MTTARLYSTQKLLDPIVPDDQVDEDAQLDQEEDQLDAAFDEEVGAGSGYDSEASNESE
jgi:hypothetical protein